MFDIVHIHPFLVHFPIALIVIGFLFEIISYFFKKETIYFKISIYLLVIGTIGAVLSQLSGLFLTNHPKGGSIYEIFEQHEYFALISVILSITSTLFGTFIYYGNKQNSNIRFAFSFLYLLSLITIIYTGYLGGTMVYDYMIGL